VNARAAAQLISELEQAGREVDDALGRWTRALELAKHLGAESDRLIDAARAARSAATKALEDADRHERLFEELEASYAQRRRQVERVLEAFKTGTSDRVAMA
jgi:exonuclease VII small subunit